MRQTRIIIPAALITAIVITLGVTVINAKSSRHANVAPASSSIDVMQMMTNAKDLPEQHYDAH
jgi:ABC-type arginine/histidine transport system permease subunit